MPLGLIAFTVLGRPAPAGSKRGFYNKKAGRVIITDDSKRSKPWKAHVAAAACDAMADAPFLEGALELDVVFYVPRPKGHFGAKGNVLLSAPEFPAVKPDLLKLTRAVEDALSGICYRDDAQIVTEVLCKRYGEPARTEVRVLYERSGLEAAA
jgi:Holliday junction resolvase RusA-like endonuclease